MKSIYPNHQKEVNEKVGHRVKPTKNQYFSLSIQCHIGANEMIQYKPIEI